MAGENRFPYPRRVKIVEIAPGYEFQNEALLDTDTKVDFIHRLSETGLRGIDVTSFIRPLVIAQDGDVEQIYYRIRRQRTLSGKIVEIAIKNVIDNQPVKNIEALANPDALKLFRDLPDLKN